MVISELIEKLQEIQKEKGDIEVFVMSNTYDTGELAPLEEDGLSFDETNEGKYTLYIGW